MHLVFFGKSGVTAAAWGHGGRPVGPLSWLFTFFCFEK
jgi:hypothetical protein